MVDLCGLNVVDGPFLWCGTKPVILGWDYFDYSLAALAIGLQKKSKKLRPKLATLLWRAGAGKIYRAPSAFDGFG